MRYLTFCILAVAITECASLSKPTKIKTTKEPLDRSEEVVPLTVTADIWICNVEVRFFRLTKNALAKYRNIFGLTIYEKITPAERAKRYDALVKSASEADKNILKHYTNQHRWITSWLENGTKKQRLCAQVVNTIKIQPNMKNREWDESLGNQLVDYYAEDDKIIGELNHLASQEKVALVNQLSRRRQEKEKLRAKMQQDEIKFSKDTLAQNKNPKLRKQYADSPEI